MKIIIFITLITIFLPSCVTTTSSKSPRERNKINANEEALAKEYIKKVRKIQQTLDNPIEYYGQIIDQNNQPVPGVTVKATIQYFGSIVNAGFLPSNSTIKRVADEAGRFSIKDESGLTLGFKSFSKQGYSFQRVQSGYYKRGSAKSGSAEHPNRISAYKIGRVANKLLTGDARFSKLIPDGRFYNIDLLKKQMQEDSSFGQLRVAYSYAKSAGKLKPSNWSVSLEVNEGGIIETTDALMYEAPATGYKPSWTVGFKKDSPEWKRKLKRKFYLKARNGEIYGRLEINFFPFYGDKTLVDITYWLNLKASRNLYSASQLLRDYKSNNRANLPYLLSKLNDTRRSEFLSSAATSGLVEKSRYILDQGVHPDTYDSDGETALISIARSEKSSLAVAKLLIERGADVNKKERRGCATPLKQAVYYRRFDFVNLFIKNGAKVNQQPCDYGSTALHVAAGGKRFKMIKLLLKHGANPDLTTSSKHEKNALDSLLRDLKKDKPDIVQLMLDAGASVNKYAVFKAAYNGHVRSLELLLKKNPNVKGLNKALWFAKANGHTQASTILKNYGAKYTPSFSTTEAIDERRAIVLALQIRLQWQESLASTMTKLRELHELVKARLKSENDRPKLYFLDSQIEYKYAELRAYELKSKQRSLTKKQLRLDAVIMKAVKASNVSLKKALTLDNKASPAKKLTRSMLLAIGEFTYADPDMRVNALKKSLDGRRNSYEEKKLRDEFGGFQDDVNYLHRSYKDQYVYSDMISAFVDHERFIDAIAIIDKQIKQFPEWIDRLSYLRKQLYARYQKNK